MLRRGSVGLLILGGLLCGCQNKPRPTPPPLQPVPTEQNVESARDQLQRVNPSAEVGTVITVWHDLAAVGDVDVSKFNVGDPVSFLDGNLNDLTMGHVIKIVGSVLQVQFDPPGAGHREPESGDLAVSVKGILTRPSRATGGAPASSPAGPEAAPACAETPATAPAPETPAAAPAAAPPAEPTAPTTAPTTQAPPKENTPAQKPDLNK